MEHQTRSIIQSKIIDAINDGRLLGKKISDIHNEVFNTDYFIIGYYESEEWLKANYGIFATIGTIKDYENNNFGEVITDLSSSEKVVNMLVYILGEQVLNSLSVVVDNWDKVLTEDLQSELLEELS